MSLSRRAFLTRSTLAVGGLLVGDAALEAFERLTHCKVFALGAIPYTTRGIRLTEAYWRGHVEPADVSPWEVKYDNGPWVPYNYRIHGGDWGSRPGDRYYNSGRS